MIDTTAPALFHVDAAPMMYARQQKPFANN